MSFLCLSSSSWGLEILLLINSLALFLSLFYVVREFVKFSPRMGRIFIFRSFVLFFFFFLQESAFIWILVWKMESFQTEKYLLHLNWMQEHQQRMVGWTAQLDHLGAHKPMTAIHIYRLISNPFTSFVPSQLKAIPKQMNGWRPTQYRHQQMVSIGQIMTTMDTQRYQITEGKKYLIFVCSFC